MMTDADILRVATEWQTRARTQTIVLNAEIIDYSRLLLAAAEPAIRAEERTRVMRAYAMRHDYLGLCPDDMQPNSYDPKCKACRAIRSIGAGSNEPLARSVPR